MKAHATIEVRRPPEHVFVFLADPLNMPRWLSGVTRARPASEGPFGEGSRVAAAYAYGNRIHDVTLEVVAYHPPSWYAYQTVAGPYPIAATFHVQPHGDGTLLKYTQEARSDSLFTSIMFTVFRPPLQLLTKRRLRKDLAKLKRLLEADGTSPK